MPETAIVTSDTPEHRRHHDAISRRLGELTAIPLTDRPRINAASRRLWATLAGHLRAQHGWKSAGPPKHLDELHEIHVAKHAEQA